MPINLVDKIKESYVNQVNNLEDAKTAVACWYIIMINEYCLNPYGLCCEPIGKVDDNNGNFSDTEKFLSPAD
jgi:hypothetical protein